MCGNLIAKREAAVPHPPGSGPVRRVGNVIRLFGSTAIPLLGKQTFRVKLGSLLLKIEVTVLERVSTGSGKVLPVAVVAGHVEIDKVFFKERSAVPPVDTVFVEQATGGYLAPEITHPAGRQVSGGVRIEPGVILYQR